MKVFKEHLIFLIILLAGIILRILFISNSCIDSDQAISGLIGMEMLKGRFVPFWWGQNYMGTLESILAAGIFAVFGPGICQLYLVPLSLWVLFMIFSYKFLLSAVDKHSALILSLLLALSSSCFLEWTIVPRGGYIETLLFGSILFFLLLKMETGSKYPYLISVIFGLIAGIALWTHLIIIYYLIPASIVIFWVNYRTKRLINILIILIFFIIGCFPLWYFNFIHKEVHTTKLLLFFQPFIYWHKAIMRFITHNIWVLLGLKTFYKPFYWTAILPLKLTEPLLPEFNAIHLAKMPLLSKNIALALEPFAFITSLSLLIVVMAGLFSIYLLLRHKKILINFPLSLKVTGLIIPINIFFIIFTLFGTFNTQRYILPVYWTLAIGIAIFLANLIKGRYRWIGLFLLLSIFLHNVFTNLDFYFRVSKPKAIEFNRRMEEAKESLNELKISHIYAGFWDGYVVTFYNKAKVIADIIGKKEYIRYHEEIKSLKKSPAILVNLNFYDPNVFREYFIANGVKWKEKTIYSYTIFYDLIVPSHGTVFSEKEFIIKEIEEIPNDLGLSNIPLVPHTKPLARRCFLIYNLSKASVKNILIERIGNGAIHFAIFGRGLNGRWIRLAYVYRNLLGFFFYNNRIFYEPDDRFSAGWEYNDIKELLIIIDYEKHIPKNNSPFPKFTLFR